jgi:hypothetical protein
MGDRPKGASVRRARVIIVGVAIVALATAASAAGARQRTSDTFTFSDPFSGSFDCGAFTATFSGHDKGRVTTWFDAADDPIVQIGRIQSTETDVNPSTGKSIDVETSLTVHIDFVAGTTTLTGVRNLSTDPGHGVVVQHVGRVVIGPDGEPISLSGKYAEFDAAYMNQDFCAALA